MQALLFIAQDTRISFGFSIFNKKKDSVYNGGDMEVQTCTSTTTCFPALLMYLAVLQLSLGSLLKPYGVSNLI